MIEGSRCPSCDRAAIPPEPRCLSCRAETEAATFPPEATVLAWTRTDPEESWIALAELDEEARVLARIDRRPRVGDGIELIEAEEGLSPVFSVSEQ